MIIRRILMEDKTSRKRRPSGFVLAAILIFLMSGAIAEVHDEDNYDKITWHDVVSSGPNRLGYSMVVIYETPVQPGEGKTFAVVTPHSKE